MPGKTITALHVCYLKPDSQSGYETRVLEEARVLRGMGHKIIITCFVELRSVFSFIRLWGLWRRIKSHTGAKVYIIPTTSFFDMQKEGGFIGFILSMLAKIHNASIIHGHALYSTIHALNAKNGIRARVIFDVHGLLPEETGMSGGDEDKVKNLKELEKRAFSSSDISIFVSSQMRDFYIKKYGLPDMHSLVVPSCVDSEKFRMSEDEVGNKRRELKINDRFVVSYLGTLSVWQWPEAMFSFFSRFQRKREDSVFLIIAPKQDHHIAASYLIKHNLPPASYILMEMPHGRVGKLLGAADVGIMLRKPHPVNQVSSPTKLGEYLASGVPVISSPHIGDFSDLIKRENVGMLVSAGDSGLPENEIERVVEFSREIEKNRMAWALRCIETADKFLGWKVHAASLDKLYKEMASR